MEVDAPSPADLNRIMTELRENYEALIAKNRKELETWHHKKVRHKIIFNIARTNPEASGVVMIVTADFLPR